MYELLEMDFFFVNEIVGVKPDHIQRLPKRVTRSVEKSGELVW